MARIRLGLGEFSQPGPFGTEAWDARVMLFDNLSQEPAFMQGLERLRDLAKRGVGLEQGLWATTNFLGGLNLDVGWMRDFTWDLADSSRNDEGDSDDEDESADAGSHSVIRPADRRYAFVFSHGWCLDRITRKDFERRIRAEFESHLSAYIRRLESLAVEQGYTRNRELRSPEQFDWFVRFQVAGWSVPRIAQQCDEHGSGLDESTVRKALRRVSKLVRIPLRKQPVGRPRKSRTQEFTKPIP